MIPLDADELIQAESRESFQQCISSIPVLGVGYLPWVTYIPHPDASNENLLPHQFKYRRKIESPQYYKIIIRSAGLPLSDVVIAQGSHEVFSKSIAFKKTILNQLHLAHFPLRNKSQLVCKATLGWLAYLAKDANAASKGVGYQWRDIYQNLIAGSGEIGDMTLTEMAL